MDRQKAIMDANWTFSVGTPGSEREQVGMEAGESMSNSGARLHDLLSAVRREGGATISAAWEAVLAVDYGTVEFAQRHGEVVNLLSDTLRNIQVLPDRTRERFLGYAPAWWTAVLSPNVPWPQSTSLAHNIIADSDLDHLGSAADLIEVRLAGTAAVPNGGTLVDLRASVEEWRALVAEATELPQPVRDVLEGQIAYLLWLIEEAPRFGLARVAQEAQGLVGALGQARSGITNPQRQLRWRQQFVALLAALGLMTGVLKESELALEAVANNIGAVGQIVHETRELVGGADEQHVQPPPPSEHDGGP